MKLKGIKKNATFKLLRKKQKSSKHSGINSLTKINKVIVIAEEELFKAYDFTNKLSQKLKIDPNNITVLLFQKVQTVNNLESYECFSEKSFSLFGKITDKNLKFLLSKKFDLLINYCGVENVYTHFVAVNSKSGMKAGFHNEMATFYNFTVKIQENKIDVFNEELIKYLNIFHLID